MASFVQEEIILQKHFRLEKPPKEVEDILNGLPLKEEIEMFYEARRLNRGKGVIRHGESTST